MTWISPITDRQQEDIRLGTPKAFLNVSDFNRIEGNIRYLREALNASNYPVGEQTHRTWTMTGVPNTGDIGRICENISMVAKAYFIPPRFERLAEIPEKTSLNYEDVNDMEEFLRWLHHEFVVARREHNTHRTLASRRHIDLAQFTHNQLRRETF